MANPKVNLIGIYRPQIDPDTWREQWESTESDEETERHFAGLVLIEGMVEGLDGPMDFGEFGQQPAHSEDPNSFMVGYEEALLSAHGEVLVEQGMDAVNGTGKLRFAVFLHEFDPARPVMWMGEPLPMMEVTPEPARLIGVVRYLAQT